jgi:hypothetical protein
MAEFVSPLHASPAQRAEASAALQDRMASVMARVAADKGQSKAVRSANARDAKTAREMAAKMRKAA